MSLPDWYFTAEGKQEQDEQPPVAYTAPHRFPDELLAADLPDWQKMVWVAIRKVQGKNPDAWASARHYGEMCGKSAAQARAAIADLRAAGWLEETGREGRSPRLRCAVPAPKSANPLSASTANPVSANDRSANPDSAKRKPSLHTPTPPIKEESYQEPEGLARGGSFDHPAVRAYTEVVGPPPPVHADAIARRFADAPAADVLAWSEHVTTWKVTPSWNQRNVPKMLRAFDEQTGRAAAPGRAAPRLDGDLSPDDVARAVAASPDVTDADFYRTGTDTRTGLPVLRMKPAARERLAR